LCIANEEETKVAKKKGEKRAGEIESAERKAAFWQIQQSAFLNQERERDSSEAEDIMQLVAWTSHDSSK